MEIQMLVKRYGNMERCTRALSLSLSLSLLWSLWTMWNTWLTTLRIVYSPSKIISIWAKSQNGVRQTQLICVHNSWLPNAFGTPLFTCRQASSPNNASSSMVMMLAVGASEKGAEPQLDWSSEVMVENTWKYWQNPSKSIDIIHKNTILLNFICHSGWLPPIFFWHLSCNPRISHPRSVQSQAAAQVGLEHWKSTCRWGWNLRCNQISNGLMI